MNALTSAEHIDAIRAIIERVAYGGCFTFDEIKLAYLCAFCEQQAPQDYGTAQAEAWDRDEDIMEDDEEWYRLHIQHAPDCPVTLARNLLAAASQSHHSVPPR